MRQLRPTSLPFVVLALLAAGAAVPRHAWAQG